MRDLHTLAILVGAGGPTRDPQTHFASLLGFDEHLRRAQTLGLIDRRDQPTATGKKILDSHPELLRLVGRANHWEPATIRPALDRIRDLPADKLSRM